ncbi:hypothetical protein evm_011869 [Chilo suppressalis]|nr:hypothetical protein evm_011869 [Chilo suppressalis]
MKVVLWGVFSVLYLLSPVLSANNGQNLEESVNRSADPSAIAEPNNSGYSNYLLDSNFANSNAQASASSNTPIYGPTLGSNSLVSSAALANSKAFSDSGAYGPYNQPFNGPGGNLVNLGTGTNSFSNAQALAEAFSGAQSDTFSGSGVKVPLEAQKIYLGQSNAQAQSLAQSAAQAASLAQALSNSHVHTQAPYEAGSQAVANAQRTNGYNLGSFSGYLPSRVLYDEAYLDLGGQTANGQSMPHIGSKFFWRPIPSNEYIRPHQFTDGPDINCRFDGELHHVWTVDFDCMVCVCLQDLSPVCASCSGCSKPLKHLPPLPPQPPSVVAEPIPSVPLLPPLPPPKPEVTCSPLPSNQVFENPLNPCQICICREIIDAFGNIDVKIECEENLQCVLPPEPLPPVPEVLSPVPLPVCDKFPVDVLFPHPTESCLVCKCIVISVSLVPVKHFTCSPNPMCEPQSINSAPYPTPILPDSIPAPVPGLIPVHIPDPISPTLPELVPLPVATPHPLSIPKLPTSPLPGPSPHESCRPFTPRQPFQHPWDDCQVCICTESVAHQRVTIEINCFSKPDCCIEYAKPQPHAPLLPYYIGDGSSNAESYGKVVLSGSQGNALAETDASSVTNSGYNLYQPSQPGFLPSPKIYYTGLPIQGGNSFAEADAGASASGFNQIQPVFPTPYPNHPVVFAPGTGFYPGIPAVLTGKGSTHALANADASSVVSNGYKPDYAGYYSGLHGLSNAQTLSESETLNYGYKKPSYTGYNLSNLPKQNSGYFPGLNSAQALAEAESSASVNSGSTQSILPIYYSGSPENEATSSTYAGYNKQSLPGYFPAAVTGQSSDAIAGAHTGLTTFNYPGALKGQSNIQAFAESEASTLTNSGLTPLSYPGRYTVPGYSGAQTLTEAEASALSNAGYIKSNYPGYYPVTLQGQTGSLANAGAEANAFTNAAYNKGSQAVFPSLYTQGLHTGHSLPTGLSTASADANSFASVKGSLLAPADANALSINSFADALSSEAQAASQASAMTSSIKSANPDFED